MVNKEIGIVFLIVDVVAISFDLTGLILTVLGRGRGNVLVEKLIVFLGQIENFVVGGREGDVLGGGGRNYFFNLVR